jgi:glutathione synthase/RimK-type ligase-like ATP-grasp enzyme
MLKPILVITSSNDKTVDYIINKFSDSVPFIRINTDVFEEYRITATNDSIVMEVNDRKVDLNTIHSIYYRKPSYPIKFSKYQTSYTKFLQQEFKKFLFGFVSSFKGKVITNPYILNKADNKLLQLKVAKEVGLSLPQTIITNDPEVIYHEIRKEKKKWVVKPLSTGKLSSNTVVYTNIIDKTFSKSDLESIRVAPHIFQKFIEKEYDLRVTIVGEKVFPVKICSTNKSDWRVGENRYEKIRIPEELKDKCLSYMQKLSLPFCAFDFVYYRGIYYFLEGNPNGQWLWLELEVDTPISNAIIDTLIK